MQHTGLSAKIADFIAGRAKDRLEKFDKNAEQELKKDQNSELLLDLKDQFSAKRQVEVDRYHPANWLTDAAGRAKQIQLVTHALKYTNSHAEGSSCYAPGGDRQPEGTDKFCVISTASLATPAIDAVGNAAALDVARLLQLEEKGVSLIEYIQRDDFAPLQPFAQNNDQLAEWVDGFKKVLTGKEQSSHTLTKQLYFPVRNKQYHLLAPLYSSSLSQEIYERITVSRFSEEAKEARKSKREGKYSSTIVVDYPNIAQQSFGGANQQNVSRLNSSRGGKSFLLSCAPPTWQTQSRPPFGTKTVFSYNNFGLRVHKEIWELRIFLESQIDKTSTVAVRDKRAERVDELIDHLIQYAAEIQSLTQHAGWSASTECRLPRHEQLWLDPLRAEMDETFAMEREKNDWQENVADHFALWLNNRIKTKRIVLGDAEHQEWKRLLKYNLEVLT